MRIAWISLALLLAGIAHSAAPRKKQAPAKAKATTAAQTSKKTTGGKQVTTARRRTRVVRRRPAYVRQSTPTPERYTEIQKALAAKGYLDAEPNGNWDDKSIAALKKFEEDQNITADGKLDSLSLIALGLGPARGNPGQAVRPAEPMGPTPPPADSPAIPAGQPESPQPQ